MFNLSGAQKAPFHLANIAKEKITAMKKGVIFC